MYSVEMSVKIEGDRELFERVSNRLQTPRTLMRNIGLHVMNTGVERLTRVLTGGDDAIRSGRLMASLQVGAGGQAGEDTVFALEDARVEVGTNVPYAAMRQFGGTIEPKTRKALAIPLRPELQRHQISPMDLDPDRSVLQFVPYTGGKPNVFALLVNPERELTGRQKKRRGALEAYPPGPLYALAYWVTQVGTPYLFIDDSDRRVINEDLVPQWLGLEG